MKQRDELIKKLKEYKSKYAVGYEGKIAMTQLIAILEEDEKDERNSN